MRIQFLSKPGCHLCDQAKPVVRRICEEFSLPWEDINIEKDPDFYEQYKEEIPVLLIDGKKIFKYLVREEDLRRALKNRRGEF
ncbi:MAG: glutaredoxin family protein [Acidobacteriia bacterium]|nr:glutaredoxin family protein [Terriglobia bacterium]